MNKIVGYLVFVCLFSGILLLNSCKKDPVIPTLTTNTISDITLTSAVSGGVISSSGRADITAKGICFGTSSGPTISGTHTSDGNGPGSFASNMTGLTPNTVYYVRAYATNKVGTAYGSEVSFTTIAIVVPTLTTTDATSIGLSTAVSGGNITADGGGSVTARGVCWATTTNPTVSNSFTSDGTGTGSFVSNITGLLHSTTYHLRAYATNSAGTSYGNEITFTTTVIAVPTLTTAAVSAITLTGAVTGGNITTDGGAAITAKGVCWATTANPTVANSKTTNGTGSANFVSTLTGLLPGITYHVRAYATNSVGTAYGNDLSFTTSAIVVPTLTTTAVTGITLTTAISGGNITADGGGSVTARGTCWATTASPTIANSKTSDATGTGTFISNLTALLPGTTYHIRAYATNSAGTAYGNDITFTTSPIVVPTLTTSAITGITLTTAVSGGNIISNGGGTISVSGICWATTTGPTVSGSKTTNGSLTGSFVSNLTGLSPTTTYYVRAYATNSAGTAYGNEVTFITTAAVVPTLTTTALSSITLTTVASGGSITSDGGASVTVKGVCWGITTNPVLGVGNFTSNGTGTGSFTSSVTGLLPGTLYYVRAYATNSVGTAYGNQFKFTTQLADNDGNTYNTVAIGSQIWMAENLKTTKFSTGTAIPNVTDNATWAALTSPAYSWFGNLIANKSVYGGLYNWFAVNTGNLCPTGWHVPTNDEYNTLEITLGLPPADVTIYGYRGTDQGTQLKNTTGWAGGNGTNTSGWSALPGGYRWGVDGTFQSVDWAYWWSSTLFDGTEAWYRRLDGNQTQVYYGKVLYQGGKYVRCMKN